MARMFACPYCYETFAARDIQFRCNTRLSRSGRRCKAERDQVRVDRLGDRGEAGPVFTADGRRPTADCPQCGGETTYRVCPVCHSLLPVQFGMVDNRLIAMVGARNSGKTVLMTVLLHELMNRVGENFRVSLMGSDESTMTRFGSDYEDKLYERRQMVLGTQSAAAKDNRVDPLVFRFGRIQDGLLGSRAQTTVLSFFDTAGEDFNSRESVELNTRYLSNADGIIVVLDPLQMRGAQELAQGNTVMPEADSNTPQQVLSRITSMLLARSSGRRAARVKTPVAVVFSKMDALWHRLPDGSPLRIQPPQHGRFDVADSLSAHEEVRDLLKQWDGVSLDQTLETNYTRYRYFGVSALGRTPTPDLKVAATGIQPYRVTDPLLWLLSEFGSVPKQGRG
ncbi:hypothetical protein ACIP2Y_20405 [Streptomyces sviceus]|uniref:TRAFAC clade GTPase domain-containing protein n=1 Tax=Streptomyces sviceus TaxID=285530 RepID=UPI0037F997B4